MIRSLEYMVDISTMRLANKMMAENEKKKYFKQNVECYSYYGAVGSNDERLRH